MIKSLISFLILLFSISCVNVATIEANRSGNMNCFYGDRLVFAGQVTVKGIALDRLDLNGTWFLCNKEDEKSKCHISLTKTSTSWQ